MKIKRRCAGLCVKTDRRRRTVSRHPAKTGRGAAPHQSADPDGLLELHTTILADDRTHCRRNKSPSTRYPNRSAAPPAGAASGPLFRRRLLTSEHARGFRAALSAENPATALTYKSRSLCRVPFVRKSFYLLRGLHSDQQLTAGGTSVPFISTENPSDRVRAIAKNTRKM
ncbi:unnamed protein product [Nesidiocoris tenuis]|uniref:Uncharacterized protein n=1 Tax=Nesidiocoris tenuis TaxID=355587 RepID=A0A6H5G1E0_9HEMI|nr:unnamed protein product [Nesidiocoris tenuis]